MKRLALRLRCYPLNPLESVTADVSTELFDLLVVKSVLVPKTGRLFRISLSNRDKVRKLSHNRAESVG